VSICAGCVQVVGFCDDCNELPGSIINDLLEKLNIDDSRRTLSWS
jgi:hypothetical protein